MPTFFETLYDLWPGEKERNIPDRRAKVVKVWRSNWNRAQANELNKARTETKQVKRILYGWREDDVECLALVEQRK